MDYTLLAIWVVMWFTAMGLMNYLFSIGKSSYYANPISNTVWYLSCSGLAMLLFSQYVVSYFSVVTKEHLVFLILVLSGWFLIPKLYKNDHYNKNERICYQTVKSSEIICQQLLFLAGFLVFSQEWYLFAVLFFIVHLPAPLVISKKFGLFLALASFPGGLIFAYLHSLGINGFIFAMAVHFAFYAILPLVLGSKLLPDIKVLRR